MQHQVYLQYILFKTQFDNMICISTNFLLDILNLNTLLNNNLPGALQWQWFVPVGILSVYPAAVEREDSPQHNVPILQ